MPIYEYKCEACQVQSSILVKSYTSNKKPACPKCKSKKMTKLLSTFAHHKTVQDFHESSLPVSESGSPEFFGDPRNIGRGLEDTYKRVGAEIPESVQQEIKDAREGYIPPEVEI